MVLFLNCFTVPAGREEEFLALWQEVNLHMAVKPGYVDHALHRSVDPGATHRFANVAHWASAEQWRAAHDEDFRALVGRPEWRPFTSTPTLYDEIAVHSGRSPHCAEPGPGDRP